LREAERGRPADDQLRARGRTHQDPQLAAPASRCGTDGSNPLPSSKESRANLISGTMPEGERYFTGSDETGLG
jgi:hypothetical protein